jgi:hypothetical protein
MTAILCFARNCCCFWSAVRILGTNLASTRYMPNSFVRTR